LWREGTFLGLWFSTKRSEKPPHPKHSHPKIHSKQKFLPPKKKCPPANTPAAAARLYRPSRRILRPLFFPPARIGLEEERREGVAALHQVGPRLPRHRRQKRLHRGGETEANPGGRGGQATKTMTPQRPR